MGVLRGKKYHDVAKKEYRAVGQGIRAVEKNNGASKRDNPAAAQRLVQWKWPKLTVAELMI